MRWIVVLALLASCDKKSESSEPPSAAPVASTSAPVGNPPPAPPVADPFEIKLRQLGDSDPATLEQAKQRLENTMKELVREEATPDGYILTFSIEKGENVQEADGRVHRVDSVEYAVQVRRMIDGTPYKCSTIVQKRETLPRAVEACKAAKKP